jgi:hypothetical protein
MTRAQVAARVRTTKEKHPERFCAHPGCLWNIMASPCKNHPIIRDPASIIIHGDPLPAEQESAIEEARRTR